MKKSKTQRFYRYAIFYIGAPYGAGEEGHVVSRHLTLDNAERSYAKKFNGTTGIYNHAIYKIDKNGEAFSREKGE